MSSRRVRVVFGCEVLAETRRALRVLETTHPPNWYIPPDDVDMTLLRGSGRRTFCEYKGIASYWDAIVGEKVARDCAWSYAHPSAGYESLRGYLSFYAARVDGCLVDDEKVVAEPGDFYGGWITSDVSLERCELANGPDVRKPGLRCCGCDSTHRGVSASVAVHTHENRSLRTFPGPRALLLLTWRTAYAFC